MSPLRLEVYGQKGMARYGLTTCWRAAQHQREHGAHKKPDRFLQICNPAVDRQWVNESWDDLYTCTHTEGESAQNVFIYKKKEKENWPSAGKCFIFLWQFSDLLQSSQRRCQTNSEHFWRQMLSAEHAKMAWTEGSRGVQMTVVVCCR